MLDENTKKAEGTGRFDYVKYDETAADHQAKYKEQVGVLELMLNRHADSRWKSLAFTKLEEFYMCVGKLIRDEQVKRNGSAPLQEERTNG